MTRTTWISLGLLATCAPLVACSTLGTKGSDPEGLPHNGTGLFRDLSPAESGVATPVGGVLFASGFSVESGMLALDRSLFYAAGTWIRDSEGDAGSDDAGPRDSDAAVLDGGVADATFDAPDWSRHEARQILRSAPRDANVGYGQGTTVLTATAEWEGGYVTDPWALVADDGSVRLYYAARGGIGVATASNVAGPYTALSEPAFTTDGSVARRPSVVDAHALAGAPHAFLMYVERDGHVELAGSEDGAHFEALGVVALPAVAARDRRDGDEVEVGGPGALVVTSPVGHSFVRLYYESRRSNGQTQLTLAASEDGVSFEAFGRPVTSERDRRFPSAFTVDARTTLLVAWGPLSSRTSQGTLFGSVAPASVSFASPDAGAL